MVDGCRIAIEATMAPRWVSTAAMGETMMEGYLVQHAKHLPEGPDAPRHIILCLREPHIDLEDFVKFQWTRAVSLFDSLQAWLCEIDMIYAMMTAHTSAPRVWLAILKRFGS